MPGMVMGPSLPGSPPMAHGPDTHGPGNSVGADGGAQPSGRTRLRLEKTRRTRCSSTPIFEPSRPHPDHREPEREIELHLTGNMERYSWSFDGKTYADARAPIPFRYGERLRLILVNDTMMEHPIHLHGMWMELENGTGTQQPRKHTISVKPAERLSVADHARRRRERGRCTATCCCTWRWECSVSSRSRPRQKSRHRATGESMTRHLTWAAALLGISLGTVLGATSAVAQAPAPAAKPPWPYPIADQAVYSNVLFDLLEYQRVGSVNALRWDVVGWRGGDQRRVWVKSEGSLYPGAGGRGEFDLQALYGRLVTPFFDLQAGARIEQHREVDRKPARMFAVVGLQGLSPYRFELEPLLFLSNTGKMSGRLTATNDLLLSQRLILQARFETEVAAQTDDGFGVDRGVNDVELGLRLRQEIRRELAPYLGLSYRRSTGAAAGRVRREGGVPNTLQVVAGVRTWF